jgi:putative ABC transport system permease protein
MKGLYAQLKATTGIAGVTISDAARKSFEATLAAVVNTVTLMFAVFGAAIAFGVIYNNNRIAFAERARELGSLHVLGFSHGEMAEILLGEMAVLTLLGLPLGVLAGRALAGLVTLVIAPATNGTAVAITVVSAVASGFAMWRHLVRLDVVSVLKAPE